MLYLGILLLGGIIGYKDRINKTIEANLNIIQNISLLFLLFIMGITIGINEEIISNLLSIGIKAGVISLASIIFSMIFVRMISKYVLESGDKIES